jgi:hypothetical protein
MIVMKTWAQGRTIDMDNQPSEPVLPLQSEPGAADVVGPAMRDVLMVAEIFDISAFC